ncbi:acylneuraminate cytidylyltransferase family protein [Mucilaginibacter sp. ZT4R22]|uniref:Acylneuraminate cytidylyltransferase family protein n=1 Tax=Mucilaginibacter pankratovii TaxID=2772110 RepID=A0ABR7WRW7_9SPHI|nr:acylneuraminate cytidylyltransferase family protein [Mucilaginibacter pankratovii]MBD1365037.1 acylneuraminate cytidylyltransferase family protein [Mucilaginibacter pankratovii]
MTDKYKLVAIVPMRHSSERVPGKNYRDFAGKPLFHHVVGTLLECELIDKVIIDTDSPTVIEQAKEAFPEVIILERPEHLRDGSIPMNDVLMNSINQVPSEFYLQTHSTNPILSAKTVAAGIKKFFEVYPMYDSLFSVTRKNVRYWDSLARPINHNPNILLRTQDLPPIFEENSCMYLFTKEILAKKHNRIGDRPYLFEMMEEEAQDIDVELNFIMAELLYKQLNNIK